MMKWLIAADIHGSAYWCRRLLECFDREQADRLLLLGDILYHGPRNDLPQEYAPKKVIEMLNARKETILCVRGNCDAEVDQMVLQFPILPEYAVIADNERVLYAAHGHKQDGLQTVLAPGSIYLQGHTHIPEKCMRQGILCINPGSVSLPKQDTPHSCIVYEDGVFRFIALGEGEQHTNL